MNTIKILLKDKAKAIENGLYKEAASICNAIGNEYHDQEKYDYALQEHLEELNFCKMIEDELGVAVANRKIGECYSSLNKFKKAIHHIKVFYDIAIKLKSPIEEQRAWATFGRTYYLKYQYDYATKNDIDDKSLSETLDRAELSYYKALKLLSSINSDVTPTELAQMKCRLLLNLGLVSEIRGDHTKSTKYHEDGMEIALKNNLYEDIHRCGYALGTLYQKLGKHEKTETVLNKTLTATKRLHNKNLMCELLLSKGTNLICLEKYKEAKSCLKSAYKLCTANSEDFDKITKSLKVCIGINNYENKLKTCNDLNERKIMLEKIADGLSSIQCFALAIKKYLMTLECLEKAGSLPSEKAPILFSLAQTYLDNKNISKALEYFEKEYNCNKEKPLEQIQTLWKIGEILEAEKKTDKSEEFYLKAVFLAKETGDQKFIYNTLNKLLALYNKLNKTNLAKEIKEKINNIANDYSSDEEVINEENEEPFGDICLSELSDSDTNEEEITVRKRSKKLESKVNELGETPLHRASISGNFSFVKRLVENGHSVNVRDNAGWTPLHEASNHGFYDIVEFLLENGADINDPGGPECKGITALHDAASCGNIDIVQLLISKGANVAVVDENGETPLDALLNWKKRIELDDITLKQCEAIEEELKLKMEEAGLKILTKNVDKLHNLDSFDIKSQNANMTGKRNRSFSSSSNSNSDTDEDVGISPYLNENNNLNCKDAKTEYKCAMENLRRSAANMILPVKSQLPKVSVPPLVNEDEIVNDWLVRDTGKICKVKKKKRKINKLNVRTSKCIDRYLISQDSSEEKTILNFSDNSNNSISPVSSADGNATKISQDKQSYSVQKSGYSTVSFCLRVNIAGKLILVPVPKDTCTVNWLKEEAALRFQAIDGSKPHLMLTKDGALLSGSDLIKNIFSNNEEVLSTVEMWDEPSLEDKYVKLCNKHNVTISSGIKKRFHDLETSFEMNLSNCCIPYIHLGIVFQTLINYKSLKVLNLSGTPLNKSNVSELVSCIPHLSTLFILNLSCCSLTSEKIEILLVYLNNQIPTTSVLPSLKNIDLSFNIFSLCPDFTSFFKLNNLTSLNLSSCELDSSFLSSKLLKTIEEKKNLEILDISDNIFKGNEICNFLRHLPKANLKELNLRCIVEKEEDLGFKLQSFFMDVPPRLMKISLQGCFLTDNDLYLISTSLTCCPQIQIIDLSANPLLSSYSVTNFINKLYESNLIVSNLNISGTCLWNSHHLLSLADCLKLKMLKYLCFDNCPETIAENIMQLWIEKWKDKATCINNFYFYELSVK